MSEIGTVVVFLVIPLFYAEMIRFTGVECMESSQGKNK